MSKRRRPRATPANAAEPAVDLGPGIVRDSSGRLVATGAADAVVEHRPDPTVPAGSLIRGARRRMTLRDMLERAQITKRQHDAAVRFLDDLSLASGPSRVGNLSGIRTAPGSRDGMSEAQLQAIRAVHSVVHLLGLNSDTVFWWVVIDNGSLRGYEDRYQRQHGTARRWLMEALGALDRHYFGARGL